MNKQGEINTAKGPYTPRARKGIHNHHTSIFPDYANMTRYGMIDSRREVKASRSSPQQDQGTDEVDNVMSKFTRQTSPMPVRQNKALRKERRGSLTTSYSETSDDDDDDESNYSNLLAKSLPANLPSYYCSNDIAHRSLPNDFYKTLHSSVSERGTEMNRSNEYGHDIDVTTSIKEYNQDNRRAQKTGRCLQMIITLTFTILSIVAGFYYKGVLHSAQGTNSIYDHFKFTRDMNSLGQKYKINDNSMLEIHSGISTILERNDTGSFIFIYNERSLNHNHLQFSNFMQDVASTAARYLRNSTVHIQPTVLHSSELDMKNHNELMKKYRNEVTKTGVMLVNDVDKIPSSLAMAFHYFCDEYNPLVARTAIFFTLNLASCSEFQEHKSTHNNVEKCLANIWKAVPKDNITPLLARVVNVVIDVTDAL